MTKFARIVNSTAIEIFVPPQGVTINDCFHPEVAARFTAVPDNVTAGSTVDASNNWTINPVPTAAPTSAPVALYEPISPMRYYMSFTTEERVKLKSSTDERVKESVEALMLAASMYNSPDPVYINPNLPSIQADLAYFVQLGILASEDRIVQISRGIAQ